MHDETRNDRPVVVAHLLHRLSPGGGVQVVVRSMSTRLDPTEVDLHVVTVRPKADMDLLDELPLTVHPLDYRGSRITLRDRATLTLGAARAVRRLRADVVQVHSGTAWLGIGTFLLSRARRVLEVHDAPGSGRHSEGSDRFEGRLARWFRITAVCHSREVEAAVGEWWNLPPAKVVRFPLGIDTDAFVPVEPAVRDAWRDEHGIPRSALVVIAIGRDAPSKGFPDAVRSVAKVREADIDAHLVLIGPEPSSPSAGVAEELGITDAVHLLGPRHGPPVHLAVASSDVLSSTSEYEGFGLTIVEGMSAGLPVVAMSVGGVPDLVDDGVTGHLVAVRDVDAHAARVIELADPDRRATMGAAARRRAVELFSHATMARRWTDLYVGLSRR